MVHSGLARLILRVVPGKGPVQKKETTSPTPLSRFCLNMCKPRVAKGCSHIPRASWKAVSGDMLKQNHIFNSMLLNVSKHQDLRPLTHKNSKFTRCPMKLTNPFRPNSWDFQPNWWGFNKNSHSWQDRLVACDKKCSRCLTQLDWFLPHAQSRGPTLLGLNKSQQLSFCFVRTMASACPGTAAKKGER